MRKLTLHFLYHKSLMSFNLPFSLFAGLISLTFTQNKLIGFINAFSLSLLTGSFILSVYFYEQRYKNQYYFYHNLGISKTSLIVGSYLYNVVLALLLFMVKIYLYA